MKRVTTLWVFGQSISNFLMFKFLGIKEKVFTVCKLQLRLIHLCREREIHGVQPIPNPTYIVSLQRREIFYWFTLVTLTTFCLSWYVLKKKSNLFHFVNPIFFILPTLTQGCPIFFLVFYTHKLLFLPLLFQILFKILN